MINDTNTHTTHDFEYFNDIMEDIINDEFDILDDDKIHLNYVGVCIIDIDNKLLLETSISPQTLFKYKFAHIQEYLDNGSTTVDSEYKYKPINIEILQLYIAEDFTYNVVVKTFWLRIVQRTWKRLFQQRKKIIQIRKCVTSQEHFRLRGKYPLSASYLPQYSGIIKCKNHESNSFCKK